jgi:solute carrier family 15 (oligopeptide transporter), member 1
MSLFFNLQLGFDTGMSTALFHTYEFFVFSFTIVGAIIADNCLGLFKTLVSMSLVYSTGIVLLSVGTIAPLNLSIE